MDSTTLESEIEELINRRRRQILIHSAIYYRFGSSIIEDSHFDKWAYQLAALQKQYPDIADKCIYAKDFKEFDGTTGFDLPLYEEWIISKSKQLMDMHRNISKEINSKKDYN